MSTARFEIDTREVIYRGRPPLKNLNAQTYAVVPLPTAYITLRYPEFPVDARRWFSRVTPVHCDDTDSHRTVI